MVLLMRVHELEGRAFRRAGARGREANAPVRFSHAFISKGSSCLSRIRSFGFCVPVCHKSKKTCCTTAPVQLLSSLAWGRKGGPFAFSAIALRRAPIETTRETFRYLKQRIIPQGMYRSCACEKSFYSHGAVVLTSLVFPRTKLLAFWCCVRFIMN